MRCIQYKVQRFRSALLRTTYPQDSSIFLPVAVSVRFQETFPESRTYWGRLTDTMGFLLNLTNPTRTPEPAKYAISSS